MTTKIDRSEVEQRDGVLVLYHRTSPEAAPLILSGGFIDTTGTWGTDHESSGVFLSNYPLDLNTGTAEGPLLRVLFRGALSDLEDFEWTEDGKPYREWCVPAAFINSRSTLELINEDAGVFLEVNHGDIVWTFGGE